MFSHLTVRRVTQCLRLSASSVQSVLITRCVTKEQIYKQVIKFMYFTSALNRGRSALGSGHFSQKQCMVYTDNKTHYVSGPIWTPAEENRTHFDAHDACGREPNTFRRS